MSKIDCFWNRDTHERGGETDGTFKSQKGLFIVLSLTIDQVCSWGKVSADLKLKFCTSIIDGIRIIKKLMPAIDDDTLTN